MFPLVSPQKDVGHGRLAQHGPNGRAMNLLATNEVLERMTAATAVSTAPATAAPAIAAAIAIAAAPAIARVSADATIVPAVTSQDVRPFRKGDLVVYPAHGIGMVDQVRVEEIGGQKLNWIKISFAENRMSLRIPVRKAKDIGLRRPVTRQAFVEVLTIIRGRPHASRLVWTKRSLEYQGKINSGSVKALAEVVRDLRPSLDGSESSFSRRSLFESAIDRLATEFAAVFRMDKAAAIDRLMAVPPAA
jgi:CarD family transcriptional regulator